MRLYRAIQPCPDDCGLPLNRPANTIRKGNHMEIKIKRVDNIYNVQDCVDPKAIYFSNDNNSAYYIILINEIPKIGLSFADFGIPPVAIQNSQDGLLYVGFGQKMLIVETANYEKAAEFETLSAVFDIFYSDITGIVVLSCETSVYLFIHDTKVDSIEFPDIIIDCNIDNEVIYLVLDNGQSYEIPLFKYVKK